jgi:cardiolipin synthase
MKKRDIPNVISVLRILLVAPVVYLLLSEHYKEALMLFFVAGVSDGLDGYLAKHYGWTSRLGSILDPIADKLLLVCCYAALGWLGHIPLWLVVAVFARDIVIVLGAVAFYWLIGRYEMEPSFVSKLNTVCQIVLVLAVVMSLSVMPLSAVTINVMIWTVLVTTILSGFDYVVTWGVRAWQARGDEGGKQNHNR